MEKKEKQEEIITAVYKLNLHCQQCARTIEKYISRTSGVQKIDIDSESGNVTVKGVFDVKRIHETMERKSKKKVELISPKPKERDDKVSEKVVAEKKEEVSKTTVVKVHMHCENCEYDLKWRLLKLKGVQSVQMNRDAQTCTVVGMVEEKKLIEYIRKKMHKRGELVPPPPPLPPPPPKQKEEEMKKAEVVTMEEIKVEKEQELKVTADIVVPYFVHCTHAPQWFSDEDPNACFIM